MTHFCMCRWVGRAPFKKKKRSLSSLGEMPCRADSSVNEEMINAFPAWLLSVDSNPNFSLPLPGLKQHKLGAGGREGG